MKKFNFNIGADPEFNITLNNQRIPAKKLIKKLFKEKSKEKYMGYNIEKIGTVGWDGDNVTGELRPMQEKSPLKLCENIEKLFKILVNKAPGIELSTSSTFAPAGGHFHFQINDSNEKEIIEIHKKMALFTLPIILAENKQNEKIRKRANYGKINEHKIKKVKDNYTYEFRSLSAEWLTSKKLAEATSAYMGVIYHEFKQNKNKKQKIETSTKNFKNINQMYVNKIKKTMKTFELYENFKEEINFILSPKKTREEKEKYNYNIKAGWGLSNSNI